jgi:hypothetical protein
MPAQWLLTHFLLLEGKLGRERELDEDEGAVIGFDKPKPCPLCGFGEGPTPGRWFD